MNKIKGSYALTQNKMNGSKLSLPTNHIFRHHPEFAIFWFISLLCAVNDKSLPSKCRQVCPVELILGFSILLSYNTTTGLVLIPSLWQEFTIFLPLWGTKMATLWMKKKQPYFRNRQFACWMSVSVSKAVWVIHQWGSGSTHRRGPGCLCAEMMHLLGTIWDC